MRSTWIMVSREVPGQPTGARRRIRERLRRLGDVVIASILLAITSPLMLFVVLAIRCEGVGPVFEHQDTVSRDRLRFRTDMREAHEAIPSWARLPTPLGRFLWQTRINALPQLLNVLRGDVSILDHRSGSPSFLD